MVSKIEFENLVRRVSRLEQQAVQTDQLMDDSCYKELVCLAPVGIYRSTREGHFLFVNKAMAKMLGYDTSEDFIASVGNEAALFINFEERKRQLNMVITGSAPDDMFLQAKRADGQMVWLRVYVRAVQGDRPDKYVYETFAVDITEPKLERDALYESEKRFRMLVEQAADTFFLHDINGVILDVNYRATEILGYTREELLSMRIQDIAAKWQKSKFWKPLKSGQYVTFESVQRRKDASTLPVEVRLSRLDLGGQVLLLSFVRDITFRKQAEDELKRNFQEIKELKNRLEEENVYLREEVEVRYRHEEIVGESPAIKKTLSRMEKVAEEDTCVLLLGETGTGKELMARAIHNMSDRRGHTMVKVNCAALPASLIENELFGREKGAFTGAMSKQIGRFEAANHSTIFLDEIGDMPMEIQTKLLRVLQDGRFERLGSPQSIKVDVRVVAATNQNLPKLIKENRFRSDLFYRLNVFPINIPSLRERLDDIPLLVWSFAKEFSQTMGKSIKNIPKKDMDSLQSYTWPGNIRELRNVIERAMILSKDGILRIERLEPTSIAEVKPMKLIDLEKNHILDVLKNTGWRVSGKLGAADILGLNESTLRSRMKKMGIKKVHHQRNI